MTVENTSERPPEMHLLGALSEGTGDYIMGMEAQGQKQLVASQVMPTKSPWDDLVGLGFVKGEPVDGDDLFVNATLPAGWTKQGTDHSMWSKIVDERGFERVSIFYKAAFYDRDSFAQVSHVGAGLAYEAIRDEGAPALPEQWSVLTEAERVEFKERLVAVTDPKSWEYERCHERAEALLGLLGSS